MTAWTPTLIETSLTGILLLQWLVFASWSFFSRASLPKKGMRPEEDRLAWSTAVTLAGWLALLYFSGGTPRFSKSPATPLTSVDASRRGTCASIKEGMTSEQVRARLGAPDHEEKEDETRGPGARAWRYEPRCTVHIFDDIVDSVE